MSVKTLYEKTCDTPNDVRPYLVITQNPDGLFIGDFCEIADDRVVCSIETYCTLSLCCEKVTHFAF